MFSPIRLSPSVPTPASPGPDRTGQESAQAAGKGLTHYQQQILADLRRIGRIDVEPRHVEAWLRAGYPTLDDWSAGRLLREVVLALALHSSASPVVGPRETAQADGLSPIPAGEAPAGTTPWMVRS